MGGNGNEAGRDAGGPTVGAATGRNEAGGEGMWAHPYCGYRLQIAILKSFQAFGSSNASRVAAHVSHDPSST